jgi:hypothetical protein
MDKKIEAAGTLFKETNSGSSFKYTLTKKVKVADKEYSELTLDFDSLTGADMENISMLAGNGMANISEFSKTYLLHVVARAAGITINELRLFSMVDCTVLTLKAQGFLMGAASETIID